MTLESTIRKMQVEEIDFDNLIESLDEGLDEGRMKELHGYIAKGMSAADIAKKMGLDVKTIEALMDDVDLDEAKYDLYHKDFSTAMQHAYKMAKKMYGITVDPEEIDDKVASGPRKPSEGKTNKYRLKGDKGAIQIQVYNKGGSKPFELNMYKEEVELDEAMLIGRDYEYDEKEGVVKISKKNFAKVKKDSKGSDPKKPMMMVLTKKGTSLVPVKFTEEVELDERSAAAQARRDARGEFDDKPEKGDDVATDADKKRGDENIINQLRKALDNPKHEVRFADGKSEVVKPDIVKAALKIFMQLKSNDKRKLQPIYAKSAKSLTSIVSRMMRKMHYEGVEEMNEDFRTGRFGVSHSLVDAVKDVIMGKRINEKEGDKEAYQKFFQKALKKFGVSSPSELKGDKEKEFYDYVDKNWTADHEESKKVNEAAKKAVKQDEEEHDDEDEKETAKKAKKDEPKKNGKEKVEVDPTLDEKLDEGSMKNKLLKTADLIQKMIKPGDPDRHDYAAARDHIEANNMKTLKKIVMKMDTVPKERIAVALAKGLGKAEAEKILGVKLNMSEEVKEEMTEAQKAKREEIVKELKKKTEDFKKKYGDRWEDVMYATATKMAMKAA